MRDRSRRIQRGELDHPLVRVLQQFVVIHREMARLPVLGAFHVDFPGHAEGRELADAFSPHDLPMIGGRRRIAAFIIASVPAHDHVFEPYVLVGHADAVVLDDDLGGGRVDRLFGYGDVHPGRIGVPAVGDQFPDDGRERRIHLQAQVPDGADIELHSVLRPGRIRISAHLRSLCGVNATAQTKGRISRRALPVRRCRSGGPVEGWKCRRIRDRRRRSARPPLRAARFLRPAQDERTGRNSTSVRRQINVGLGLSQAARLTSLCTEGLFLRQGSRIEASAPSARLPPSLGAAATIRLRCGWSFRATQDVDYLRSFSTRRVRPN